MKKIARIFLGIILTGLILTACGGKESAVVAKSGDTVKIDYTGTLSDGSVFDSSVGSEPLEFTLGQGTVIPGFENAVLGMKVGETKTVTILSAEAYGQRDQNLVFEVPISQLPSGKSPEVGDKLRMQDANGTTAIVTITAVSEDSVTIDANHELAGKDLTFKLTLIEIVSK